MGVRATSRCEEGLPCFAPPLSLANASRPFPRRGGGKVWTTNHSAAWTSGASAPKVTAMFWKAFGAAILILWAGPAAADEGMWPFDEAPVAQVRAALGVELDAGWLDHLRGASVRLTTGCSASIASPEGLVLTNHHCIVACVQHLSAPNRDYVRDGFVIDSRTEER